MGGTLAAGVRRLPRASDLSGSGLSNALPIGILGQGSGALLGGVQAQPATSPSPPPAASAPSGSATGSSQPVPLVSTPAGLALGVAADRVRDQVFADLEGTQGVGPGIRRPVPIRPPRRGDNRGAGQGHSRTQPRPSGI